MPKSQANGKCAEDEMARRVSDMGAELEHIMSDTIERIADMHERLNGFELHIAHIPEVRAMLTSLSTAQVTMAQSAQSMAETFRKAEERAEKAEVRYAELASTAAGKDQIPLKSHYWTVIICMIPVVVMALVCVLGVLYLTRQELSASLTEIKVGQQQTQEKIEEVTKEVQDTVEQAK